MKLSQRRSHIALLGAVFLIGWNAFLTIRGLYPPFLSPASGAAGETESITDAARVPSVRNATGPCAPLPDRPPSPPADGIHPVYRSLLVEAERRTARSFAMAHRRGERGIVIGPTDGDFVSHTLLALRNARRIRNMLWDPRVKMALATVPKHIRILTRECQSGRRRSNNSLIQEACRLWANGTLFDDIVTIRDEYRWNDHYTNKTVQASSRYWLRSLGSYRHAPYKVTLVLDTDAFTCPGFEELFQLAAPRAQSVWQLPNQATTDFAAGIDQYPFGTGPLAFLRPGNATLLQDFDNFPERNTGTLLFHFHRPLSHTFVEFVPLVAEYIWNHKAGPEHPIRNDQAPFRVAAYLFRKLRPEFVEQQIPQHAACRTYPGRRYSGTSATRSRMLPPQADGMPCTDCACSPCLVAHFSLNRPLPNHGTTGFELDAPAVLRASDKITK